MARRNKNIIKTNKFLQGLAERFGEAVKNAGVEQLRKGAEQIARTAKNLCPVRTGNLRNSIRVRDRSSAKTCKIQVIADATDDKGVCYARIVEFSPKINKPFLYPARDEHAPEIRGNALDAIRDAIQRECKK